MASVYIHVDHSGCGEGGREGGKIRGRDGKGGGE